MDYKKVANEVLAAIGGKENIKAITHCATRLRFSLNDNNQFNLSDLEKNENVLGVLNKNGNYQVIIGTEVPNVYNAILESSGSVLSHSSQKTNKGQVTEDNNKKGWLDRFLQTVSAIFTPYIPVLATSGILLGIVAIVSNFGWLSTKDPTYITLSAIGHALIYFFPILLAFSAAQRFKANPYIAATIGAAVMYPDLNTILVSGAHLNFIGIPYIAMNFGNTVIPILLAIWAFSYLERFLKTYLPKALQFTFVPLISIFVMVPLSLMVIGPIGALLANAIAHVYNLLINGNIIVFSTVFGALFIFVIMFGLHWVILPLQLQILSQQGHEYSLAAGGMGNYALLGVTLAVLLFSKDKKLKEVAGSAAFVNIVSGITEPGLYGVCFKNKRYFLALLLGGTTGGLICGLFGVYIKAFAFTGILGLPAFAAASKVFPYYLLAVFASIAVGFVTTLILDRSIKNV